MKLPHKKFRLFTAMIVMAVCICCITGGQDAKQKKQSTPNEIPRSWNFAEIAKQAPPFGVDRQILEDDRPLRVESSLVLQVSDNNRNYTLSHLYRHPNSKDPKWHLSMGHVSGKKGTKYYPGLWLFRVKGFDKRPTNKDLYKALCFDEVNWSFQIEKGWKIVGCGVCEKSWQEAIGEKPTQYFKQSK